MNTVLVTRLGCAAALGLALLLPQAAMAQGWGGGGYGGGYGEGYGGADAGRYAGRGDDDGGARSGGRDRGGRGWEGERGDGGGREWDQGRRGWDGERRGWDGDRRGYDDRRDRGYYERHAAPGWGGGAYPDGRRWWHGRWWNYGAGPCWRWSQWRQNWKWVCD